MVKIDSGNGVKIGGFLLLARKKTKKNIRTGRNIYKKKVEERKTIFPKDRPATVTVRRNLR